MKKSLPTVTIGIPAYNEEATIGNLLDSLLDQKQNNFRLKKIVIASDGSADGTNTIVKRYSKKNSIVVLIKGAGRYGKPRRINQIFSYAKTKIVVILDADIAIKDSNLINKLIKPLVSKRNCHLTSGGIAPKQVATFAQMVAMTGIKIWKKAIELDGKSQMYNCNGPVRAFSQKLYQKIKFPDTSADDVYPYIYSNLNGFGFKYVKNAKVYYSLPNSIPDYIKQMSRFVKSKNIHQSNFSKKIVDRYYTINNLTKILAAIIVFMSEPIYVTIYIFVSFYIHIRSKNLNSISSIWEIVQSTKTNLYD